MENSAIEKFIKTIGITYNIKRGEKRFNKNTGNYYICLSLYAHYEGKTELEIHYCYAKKRNGEVVFDEGNIVKDPENGIFAYLGNSREVYNYFKEMTRKIAEDFFSEDDY